MTCIVIFLALLIERFFDWSHLRNWHWFGTYQQFITEHRFTLNPYLILMVTIAPILVLVFSFELIINGWLYGLIKFLFNLFVLLYTFGPKNLWVENFTSKNVITNANLQKSSTRDNAETSLNVGLADAGYSKSLHWFLLNNIFIAANNRIFAVIFWFLILGPIGAVLYRTVSLLTPGSPYEAQDHAVAYAAKVFASVLDWLPIRILTFLFALGGHFVHVVEMWRKYVSFGLTNNETMLTECGIAALGLHDQETLPEDGSAVREAESLIDRVFFILIIIAIIAVFIS